MPYCQYCGSYVSELETNCQACGAIVYPAHSGDTAVPVAKKSAGRGLRIVIAVAVIVCVAAGLLWALIPHPNADTTPRPGSDPLGLVSGAAPSEAPSPTANATSLRLGSWWHGYLQISNYEGSGESLDGSYEVWGYLGAASGRRPYFELYDSETIDDDTTIMLSMFVELYPDHFVPVIGEDDAWFLDIYLDERDVEPLTVYCEDGCLAFSYAYLTNEESFDIDVIVYAQ